MIGLYLKDVFFFKKYWLKKRYILSFLVVLTLAIFFLKENSTLISIFITMLFLNSIPMFFVEDIKSGWREFINATALTNNEIIFSRFLSSISVVLFSNIISLLLNIILYLTFGKLSIKEYLLVTLITFTISILFVFILLPFIYMFSQNGLIISLIFLFITGFLISKTNNFIVNISDFIQNSTYLTLGLISVLAIFILGLFSFFLSKQIYKIKLTNSY